MFEEIILKIITAYFLWVGIRFGLMVFQGNRELDTKEESDMFLWSVVLTVLAWFWIF